MPLVEQFAALGPRLGQQAAKQVLDSCVMTAFYVEALGGHYAADVSARNFAGASSVLFMLADAIRRTPVEEARSAAGHWAEAIDYVAGSPSHNGIFVAVWVKPKTPEPGA